MKTLRGRTTAARRDARKPRNATPRHLAPPDALLCAPPRSPATSRTLETDDVNVTAYNADGDIASITAKNSYTRDQTTTYSIGDDSGGLGDRFESATLCP